MKKFGALLLAIVMVLSLTGVAFASETINGGNTSDAPTLGSDTNIVGESGTWIVKDTERIQTEKKINIVKELVVFNSNSESVYAPAFVYKYTVKPASVSSLTVQDEDSDHKSGKAVEAPVYKGVTTGLKVNDGTPGNDTNAVGLLTFDNTMSLNASTAGASNKYNVELDFTGVSFEKPGVYRYEISEEVTLADGTSATYDEIAIKDNGSNTRYLDVYVDGKNPKNIYGFVCMVDNASVTPSTQKTNGFVTGSDGQDFYYTYDLELSKDVVNDTYGEGHPFPFTVIFKNTEEYKNTFTITETPGMGSTGINPSVASTPTWKGVAKVKKGGSIIYTGIPAGVDVDVYETNDMTGVTYTVTTAINGTDRTPADNNVSANSTPTEAVEQSSTKNIYESTVATIDTRRISEVNKKQTLAITNELLLISPTGVVLRIAPYAMILAAGIALLLISRRRTATVDED